MKTQHTNSLSKTMTLALTFFFFSLFSNLNAQNNCGEDNLNLDDVWLTDDEANDQIEKGLDYVRVNEHSIQSLVYSIPLSEIQRLKDTATKMFNNSMHCAQYPHGFTGLKISIGIDPIDDTKLHLLFQPMYMHRIIDDPNATNNYTLFPEAISSKIYKFQDGTFQTTENTYPLSYYQSRVRFNCWASPLYRNFRYDGDWTGDTKSVIYPFQELTELINGTVGTKSITIYSVGYRVPSGLTYYTKHGLVLAANNWPFKTLNTQFKFIAFVTKNGDRGNLCPPDCDNAAYRFK